MASETEGIALLSMYNDEEEDDEEPHQQQEDQLEQQEDDLGPEPDEISKYVSIAPIPDSVPTETPPSFRSPSPLFSANEIKTLRSPTPPPISLPRSQRSSPLMLMSPSPPPPLLPSQSSLKEPVDGQWTRRGALVIVDYAHDESAMSPEPEEGEILSSSCVVIGSEIQAYNGYLDERTPPGTVQILTPGTQPEPPQPSDFPEQPKSETSMAIDSIGTEPEVAQAEIVAEEFVEMQKDDPLKSFLPPPLTIKCPDELQEKINKFLAYKRAGKSFNADLRNRKDYRNPDFLQHAVRYQDIDQIGTCFSKDVFDPHGYDKSDYFDEIEAAMKREMERREQERKKGQKVDFVGGATQPGTVAPVLKLSTQIPVAPGSAAVTSGLQSVSTAVDAISREIRQNKKTKWDKIDGDVKNPLHSGGSDNLSAVGVHAAHLSAANAGTGYTAFAQQKRREAEERRSGERKFDKRS